jgi:hypothetical protein
MPSPPEAAAPAPRAVPSVTSIYLKFDTSVPYGSVEHYYHFLLGYLLPCVHTISGLGQARRGVGQRECRWHVRSCGPLMDRILEEALGSLGVWYEVASAEDLDARVTLETVTVPRFDWWIAGIRWRAARHRSDARCGQMLGAATRCAALLRGNGSSRIRDGAYLLIRRSEQPEYYRRGGPAEIAGYGTGRRSLPGIEEAAEFLARRGIEVEVFEPGQHSLATQIDAFRRCRGVIAMRGAELANMVWLSPGSRIFMFHPPMGAIRAPQSVIAALMGLDLVDMPVPAQHHRIDPILLERTLRDRHPRLRWAWPVIRRALTASIARLP